MRRALVLQGREQHHHNVAGFAFVEQRINRRIGGIASIPVRFTVDLDRPGHLRQAGRGQNGVGADLWRAEQPHLARIGVGRGNVELDRAFALKTFEIDLRQQNLAQRIDIERVELVRRKVMGKLHQHLEGRHQADVLAILGRHGDLERQTARNRHPEFFQRRPCAIAAAAHQAVGKNNGIHGAGAGAADTLEVQAPVLQQAIEYAPGECAVGAAPLQGKVYGLFVSFSEKHNTPPGGRYSMS